jgi:hypothetical protein
MVGLIHTYFVFQCMRSHSSKNIVVSFAPGLVGDGDTEMTWRWRDHDTREAAVISIGKVGNGQLLSPGVTWCQTGYPSEKTENKFDPYRVVTAGEKGTLFKSRLVQNVPPFLSRLA